MVLENKVILLISPEPWDHIFVSKHHYAIHLGKRGNKVYFLGPAQKGNSVKSTEFENVFSVTYSGFPKGLRFFPWFLQRFFIGKKFRQLQNNCSVLFDLIWSFDNSVFYDFSALPKRVIKISHIVDLNQNFQFQKASLTADLNLANTRTVLIKQLKLNNNSYFINHGYAKLADRESSFKLSPVNNKIRIGYAGNLDIKYLDWNLINLLVKEHQHSCDFFFAGSLEDQHRLDWFKSNSNIHYVGSLNTSELTSFCIQMDILLISYKADQYSEQLENSHKMMEYLGSGKMVVATFTQEYIDIATEGLFLMSNKTSEFPTIFKDAILNLEYWNEDKLQNRRKIVANENSYDKQIQKIEKLIEDFTKSI